MAWASPSEHRDEVIGNPSGEVRRHGSPQHHLGAETSCLFDEERNPGEIEEGKSHIGSNVDQHIEIAVGASVVART